MHAPITDKIDSSDHVLIFGGSLCLSPKGLVYHKRIEAGYTTAKSPSTRRKIFPLAAMAFKAAVPRPILFAPPPDRSYRLARVGFLVGHRGCFHYRSERKAVSREKNLKSCRPLQSTLDESFRQWVFDILLQSAPERPRAIVAIAAGFLKNPLARLRCHHNLHLPVHQRFIDLTHEQIDDQQQVTLRERIKQNHFIEAIQKNSGLNTRFTSPITISSWLFEAAASSP